MNDFLTEKEKGTTATFGNVFDKRSNRLNTIDSAADGVPDFDNTTNFDGRCKKRPMTDLCCSSTCISFKELEKRVRLSTECKGKGENILEDIIIISSDDDDDDDDNEELDAISSGKIKGYFGKNIFSIIEENANSLCSPTKSEKDGTATINQATIDRFFSPRKKEVEQRPSIKKQESAEGVQNEPEPERSGKPENGHVFSLGDSPIASSFFSKRTLKENSSWKERVGSSAPLLALSENHTTATSLKPRDFSTCQVDFIDGLADDEMFYNTYIDTVLSFTSKSIAPPSHIVMRIFSKIAQCSDRATTLKAVNCLKRLLSIKVLTYENFHLTWDIMVELASNCLHEIETFLARRSSLRSQCCCCCCDRTNTTNGPIQNENLDSKFCRLFLFVVSFLEEDFKRYSDSIRCCIFRKILSPCLHGFSRLRKVENWLVTLLQMLENAEDMDNNNESSVVLDPSSHRGNIDQCGVAEEGFCAQKIASSEKVKIKCHHKKSLTNNDEEPGKDFGRRIIKALQRLFHLSFLLSRDAKDEARAIAELFLNCFFELRTLRWRKIFLSSIEPCLVRQATAELILSTVFEDSTNSAEYQNSQRLSLEIIVCGYFYKRMPYENGSQWKDNYVELFIYLLWMLVRSYLAVKNSKTCRAMGSLSVLNEQYGETSSESGEELMSLSDRQTLLYIKEEVDLLRKRMLRYRGSEKLNINSELGLNLLKEILDNFSQSIGDI